MPSPGASTPSGRKTRRYGSPALVRPLAFISSTWEDNPAGITSRCVSTGDVLLLVMPIGAPLLPSGSATGVDQRDADAVGDVQELETHVTSRQGIVVVLRSAAGGPAVDGAERGQIRTVDRIEHVGRIQLEHLRWRVGIVGHERRIVEAVLEEVGEIVHLRIAQAETDR